MTQLFVNRPELIPEGETTEDHRKCQKEEADIVERDKSNTDRRNGGLFRGCFRSHRPYSGPIVDEEDGVRRCPVCAWEIEDGVCQQCSLAFGSDGEVYSVEEFSESEISFDSEGDSVPSSVDTAWHAEHRAALGAAYDDDGDISLDGNGHSVHTYDDMADGEFAFGRAAAQGLLGRPIRRPSHANAPLDRRRNYARSTLYDVATTHTDSAPEDSDSEDEAGSLDEFIINDEDQDQEPPSTQTLTGDPYQESEVDADFNDLYSAHPDIVETDDDDSDEGGAISNGRRRRRMQSSSPTPDDHTERETGADSEPESPEPNEGQGISRAILQEGWSPLHQDDAGVSRNMNSRDMNSRDSDGGSSPGNPIDLHRDSDSSALPQRSRRRRPLLSEFSSGDDSAQNNTADQIMARHRQSSSGTVTLGRESPMPGSTGSSPEQSSRQAWQSRSPILINSSPATSQTVGLERNFQHSPGRRARSQSNFIPLQSAHRNHANPSQNQQARRDLNRALNRALLGRSSRHSVSPQDTRHRPSPRIHSPHQELVRAAHPSGTGLAAREQSETSSDGVGLYLRHSANTEDEYQNQRRRYKERRRQQRARTTSTTNQGHTGSRDSPGSGPMQPARRGARPPRSVIEEEEDDMDTYVPNLAPYTGRGAYWEI